jgi:hypothetical protein
MIRRRFLKGTWALSLLLSLALLGGDTMGAGSVPEQAARAHIFSIYTWHVENFPVRWPHTLRRAVSSTAPASSVPQVEEYFALNREINGLRRAIEQDATDEARRHTADRELADLIAKRDGLKYGVERAIEDLITLELQEQGLTRSLLGAEVVWPPVYFRLSHMPPVLVVSPRDEVRVLETHLLAPDMTEEQVLALEESIDSRGLSSLVVEIGGVATYPSLVPDRIGLEQLLEVASHEWVHQYLFFRPLGQGYWDSGEMTVINETVADLAGRELGAVVHKEYFETGAPALRAAAPPPIVLGSPPAATFDFNLTMRETRQTLDRLLKDGKVEEAEGYLEERRQILLSNGYRIRKLNQAYFAFHGNYAERPGSINPIGGWVRTIRQDSADLKAFLERVGRYTSLDDLKRDVWNTQQKRPLAK